MIVFAGVTPHPPILLPEIGKENTKFVSQTVKSMQRLASELYAAKPDTVILISPHGPMLADAFALNMAPEFTVGFKEFGDLATEYKVKGDVGLIHHYKEILESQMQIVLVNKPALDHGAGVPLHFFFQAMPADSFSLVPMSFSLLDYATHFTFGRKLQEDIINDTKRIAIIASGDLSHRLTEDAPAGYSHWAKKFDETLLEKVQAKDHEALINMDTDFIEEAGECGLRSIIILMGMLNSMNYNPDVYSYEGPFGVGYAVINLKLNKK